MIQFRQKDPMPSALATSRSRRPENRRRWTRQECEFLEKSGLLIGRYELLDGEIIVKMGQKQPHAQAVIRVIAWLLSVFGVDHVQSQTTIEVAEEDRATNRPEPDAIVLRRSDSELEGTPEPTDIALVIEVSDTTLSDDKNAKAALYARAGIAEYWVLDVTRRRIGVHRDPDPAAAKYRAVTWHAESATLCPQAAPQSTVRPAELLPPRKPAP